MKTEIKSLNNWLLSLESRNKKIVGIYEIGSTVLGFSDENSDRDFIVIWEEDYPKSKKREKEFRELNEKGYEFKDIPKVKKGVDIFFSEGQLLNVAHVCSIDFFESYEQLKNLKSYYEEQLMGLGAFKHSKIWHDPEGRLERYREEIIFTPEIANRVMKEMRKEIEYFLKLLEISLKRDTTLRSFRLINKTLKPLHIWYYAEKGMWLMSDKWFKRFVQKYGWDDEFVGFVNEMEGGLGVKETGKRLLEITKDLGFTPSNKHRA